MTARNDITGDAITNNKGNHKKFRSGWDAIWGNKEKKEEVKQKQEKKDKE